MPTFKLSDGRTVQTIFAEYPGMAGESMTVLQFIDTETRLHIASVDVKSKVSAEIRQTIEDYEKVLADENSAAAKAWII